MDAAGDEQAVDAGGVGAGDVGAKAVADAQDAAAILDPEKPEATGVDRRVGLAVIGDRAPGPSVGGGQRPRADAPGGPTTPGRAPGQERGGVTVTTWCGGET